MNPEVGSGSASDLWVLKNGKEYNEGNATADDVGVKAVDDYTLEVETSYYAPWFVSLTATTVYFPVKQSVVDGGPIRGPRTSPPTCPTGRSCSPSTPRWTSSS